MQRAHTSGFVMWLMLALIFMLTNWPLWNQDAAIGLIGLETTAPVVRYLLLASLAALSVQFILAQLWVRGQTKRVRALERELNAARAELYQRHEALAPPATPKPSAPPVVPNEPAAALAQEHEPSQVHRTFFRVAR